MGKGLREKYQNMALPLKASLWFVVCGIFKDAIDVLMTPIFTRILTTEQYGIFNVYNSWFQIAKIIFTLFLFSDVFNVGLVKFEKDRDRFISATLGFVTTSVSFFLALYLVFREQLNRIIGLPGFLVLLLFAHVLVYVPYYCWIRRERFDYHYRTVVAVSFLYIIFQPLIGILAILCLNIPINPGHTRIVSAVGVQIVIGIILYIGMMIRGRTFFDRGYWKYSLRTGVELVPFNLSKIVLNQSDRIMINYYSGPGDTGIYSVAHSAAFVLQVLTESLNGAFVPWLYRRLKVREWNGIRTVINGMIVLVAAGALGIELIAPEIMRILGSAEYYEGVYCIPPLVYSVYLICIYTIFSNLELFYGRNIFVTAASTAGMIVNIALNALFIPRYGFIAAGYTTLVSYAVICVTHCLFLKKCLNTERIKIHILIDIRTLLLVSLLLLILTLLCEHLYQWQMVRRGLIAILLVMFIISRKRLVRFLNEIRRGK